MLLVTLAVVLLINPLMLLAAPGDAGVVAQVPNGAHIWLRLNEKVDASKANTGDQFALECIADVIDEQHHVLIPTGAKITARAVHVVKHTKEHPTSELSLLIERAEWPGGSTPLHAFISSLNVGSNTHTGSARNAKSEKAPAGARHAATWSGVGLDGKPVTVTFGRDIVLPGSDISMGQQASVRGVLRNADDPALGSVIVHPSENVVLEKHAFLTAKQWSPE